MSATKQWWQRYGLTSVLGIAASAGLVAVGIETDWGRNLRATGLPRGGSESRADLAPTIPAFSLGDLDLAFKESGERPLFSPSRRPPQATTAAATPQMKRGQFKLTGTVVNAETSVAYLVELAGNKTHRVNKGGEVLGQAGLRVDMVEPNRVVLKLGEETEVLELRTASSPPAPKLPAAQSLPPMPGAPAVAGTSPTTANAPPTVSPVPTAQVQPPSVLRPPIAAQNVPGLTGGIPGFVLPAQTASPADASAQPDPGSPAARRRRFQNPQQPAPQ